MDAYYFDYAASYPASDIAIQAVVQAMRVFGGNPSSPHGEGRQSQRILRDQKNRLLDLLNCKDGRVVLCASASEANTLVIEHFIQASDGMIVIADDVHPCIRSVLERYPQRCKVIPVNKHGEITVDVLCESLKDPAALVCLSHVSHETGVIQDVSALAAACDRLAVPCLIDGAQAVGHMPVDIAQICCDYYVCSGHKFGGPLGMGALLIKGAPLQPRVFGGHQEYGMRAGTENIAALCGSVAALSQLTVQFEHDMRHVENVSAHFQQRLKELIPQAHIVAASATQRAPHIVSVCFDGIEAAQLIEELSLIGFCVASGSACTAQSKDPSPVLLRMGFTESQALGCIRVSFAVFSSIEAVNELLAALQESLGKLVDAA